MNLANPSFPLPGAGQSLAGQNDGSSAPLLAALAAALAVGVVIARLAR